MKTLNLEIKDKAVDEFINSLDQKGILSNFIEQCCSNLLKGGVVATPEEELTKTDNDSEIKVIEGVLDELNNLEEEQEKEEQEEDNGGGYFELDEEDIDMSEFDEDFDDDVFDDEEDEMRVPPPPISEEEESTDNSEEPLTMSDREVLKTVMSKLDKLLSIAESGGFSGSRVAPLTFSVNTKSTGDSEQEDVVADDEPSDDFNPSDFVSDLVGNLDIQRVISINNKLSGR